MPWYKLYSFYTRKPKWCPSASSKCGMPFNIQWLSKDTPLDKIIRTCPQCKIPHSESFPALTIDFVQSELAENSLYAKDEDWPLTEDVRQSTLAKVNFIRESVLFFGRHDARLYQNRRKFCFP